MVRRRRNERDPRCRVACPGDVLVYFMAGQLTTFAGLGPLRNLDLQFIGVCQVGAGHTETPGRDLLDRTARQGPVGIGGETLDIFTAFARIAATPDGVHSDGNGLMNFWA